MVYIFFKIYYGDINADSCKFRNKDVFLSVVIILHEEVRKYFFAFDSLHL